MTYRAVVIGAGRIGLALEADDRRPKPATHAGMWMHHPATELAALCDVVPEFEAVAREIAPEARCYGDIDEMLSAERPDIVSIATHQDSHVAVARRAIDAGVKAIACEKPISDDLSTAQALVTEAAGAGVHLIVNHARRFDPALRTLASNLQNGVIGEVLQVTGYYVYGLISTGTHLIDLLRMTLTPFAGDVSWVAAWPNRMIHHHPDGDICVDGVIGFESGLKANIQSLDMRSYDHFELRYYGRSGLVTFDGLQRRIDYYEDVDAGTRSGFRELSATPLRSEANPDNSYFAFLADHLVDCLGGNATVASSGEDSVHALAILQAMSQSAERGGEVVTLTECADVGLHSVAALAKG